MEDRIKDLDSQTARRIADLKGSGRVADALLIPVVQEAMHHPALREKIRDALAAAPNEASPDRLQEAIVGALVKWMQDGRIESLTRKG